MFLSHRNFLDISMPWFPEAQRLGFPRKLLIYEVPKVRKDKTKNDWGIQVLAEKKYRALSGELSDAISYKLLRHSLYLFKERV